MPHGVTVQRWVRDWGGEEGVRYWAPVGGAERGVRWRERSRLLLGTDAGQN